MFRSVAVRLPSFDLADRFLGFLAPTVIIGILASFLASFVLAFALLLLPWSDLTLGDALRESGSSVFTLGFVPVLYSLFFRIPTGNAPAVARTAGHT